MNRALPATIGPINMRQGKRALGNHFDVGDHIGSSTSEQRQPNFARFGPSGDFTQLQRIGLQPSGGLFRLAACPDIGAGYSRLGLMGALFGRLLCQTYALQTLRGRTVPPFPDKR